MIHPFSKMSVGWKLTLSFAVIFALNAAVGLFSLSVSEDALQRAIKADAILLTHEMMDKLDRNIHKHIEVWETYTHANPILSRILMASNQSYAKLANPASVIREQDAAWIAGVRGGTTTLFMQSLIDDDFSKQLRTKAGFYENRYRFPVVPEIFVTNKYGVNVAQTGLTSDFYQADETWWSTALHDGLYIGDVDYDESAGVYAIAIGIRVDDAQGNAIGVMKVILNIEEVIPLLKEATHNGHTGHGTMRYTLITRDGRVIYAVRHFNPLEKVAAGLLKRLIMRVYMIFFFYLWVIMRLENQIRKFFSVL